MFLFVRLYKNTFTVFVQNWHMGFSMAEMPIVSNSYNIFSTFSEYLQKKKRSYLRFISIYILYYVLKFLYYTRVLSRSTAIDIRLYELNVFCII